MTVIGTPTLATRAITQEEVTLLRKICDEHKFSYGVFCSLIVKDVLNSQDLIDKYIAKVQQFEDDQQPASIEEMKALRETLRKQEEELQTLRAFKEAQLTSLSATH